MRFSILTVSIAVGVASASPCRPSSSEISAETTTAIFDSTSTVPYSFTSAIPSSTTLPIDETVSASQTSSEAESTTESIAAVTSTAAVAPFCGAPAALQCCNTVGTSSDPVVSLLIGLLGIVIQNPDTLMGATCSRIDDIGACNQTPVCCSDNSHGGLISIGCTRVRE
ncbi:uncharacterized protein B0J16DRAFT_349370 [Fusarium flagelliforme]|uniref:Hydrophobin n=1 Tax=Fusarium flagelliforme TaxID=2675880 RepID=A0A395MAP8_9HYPO|nr:uncharacterized protein B0J16DRAFT_349370 [Fusarium flagelliforme]KAH7174950.1 hypothetical protein B0J16DRAFT_349370 [Fusarium flagelliforme]RFN44890.1 hydrophobin-domain-containing protein [Fusarium flagelliforme]